MKVKGESEKVGLKLNIQRANIMASSPIISWQIDGEIVETVADLFLGGFKITADGDCSHEIKRYLLLEIKRHDCTRSQTQLNDWTELNWTPWKESYDQPRQHIKKQRCYVSTKVCLSSFPVVMCGCDRWTIKKPEHWRIDAFELWCWRRILRVPWTARKSNQSMLKEISPGCSLEGLMLKLKLQ